MLYFISEIENFITTVKLRHVYVFDEESPSLNSSSHQNSTVIENSSSTAVENSSSTVTENSTAQSEENSNNVFLTVFAQKSEQSNNSNNNNNNNINNNCGISSYTDRTNLLINNGEETMPGQWPWLVALFVVRKDHEFKCAGSILTTKHVITGISKKRKKFNIINIFCVSNDINLLYYMYFLSRIVRDFIKDLYEIYIKFFFMRNICQFG